MKNIFRGMSSFLAFTATYLLIYYFPLAMIRVPGEPVSSWLISLSAAVAAGWAAWRISGKTSQGLAKYAILGAMTLGWLGFAAGFFGPMIFAPQANQGPLLGIFITGPLGFMAGGLGGLFLWLIRRKSKNNG